MLSKGEFKTWNQTCNLFAKHLLNEVGSRWGQACILAHWYFFRFIGEESPSELLLHVSLDVVVVKLAWQIRDLLRMSRTPLDGRDVRPHRDRH